MKHKILIIDDEKIVFKSNKSFLEKNGFEVHTALGGDQGVKLVKENPQGFSVILLDYHMPGKNGVVTLQELLLVNPDQLVIIFSSDESWKVHSDTVGTGGAYTFMPKNIKSSSLLNIIKGLCEKHEQNRKVVEAPIGSTDFELNIQSIGAIGRSEGLSKVATQATKFATSNSTVLILGETGVGKSRIAEAIHNLSPRKDKKFLAINCGNFTKELLESELFGHVKGSFTGAYRDKDGIFLQADGGTIFLDEIGEMDLDLQKSLLKVLEDKMIKPVGCERQTKVDVRIIAASHVDFKKAVENNTFREDLFYRLNILTINIPPLRERRDDIEPLIAHFTKKFNKENGTNKHFLQRSAYLMSTMEWRGNVRELENFVIKNLTLIDDDRIPPSKLVDSDGKLIFTNETAQKKLKTIEDLFKKQEEEQKQYVMENFTQYDSLREALVHESLAYSTGRRLLAKLGIENLFNKSKTV